MTWQGLDNITNTGNASDLLKFPSLDFPMFWGLILFSLFAILSFRTYNKQIEKTNSSNIWSSFATAGFMTSLFALILNLSGIINNTILIYTISATILFVAITILGKE